MTARRPVRVLAPREEAGRITRRALLGGFAVVGAASVLGCGRDTSLAATASPDGDLEGRVNVYSWGDYEAPKNLRRFSRRTGVTVQVDAFGSNEEMIAKLGASRGTSGYDVIVPTGQFVPMMAANDLLVPLDHDLLPNMKHLDPQIVDPSWDPGNEFTVPKAWGTTGFAYDTQKIDSRPTSWQDFLDLASGQAAGSVSLLDDPWEVCSIYFAANGIDPNTTDEADLDAAQDFLVGTLAPEVRAYSSNPTQSIVQSELALIQAYNGDARWGILESDDPDRWRWVYPTPTANLWIDTWAIATGAQHIDSAHAFINYMLDPKVSMRELDWNGYPTGVAGLEAKAEEWELELTDMIFPPTEVTERLTAAELTDAQDRLTDILQRMQAAA
ncbi:spermidine/putrescine transport system substrate-binding protein [Mumia flava]|uniref:Spermidine/putrescine transport system substrate-binding protein n=1 Tax=Mumia flava TaxID=1348852 RepID=A0A0B2BPI0_9ACTN|nr:spermidine/putrescine ABC transporter substrate-binding protein [Mumia flava]PJJ57976.1 spermidine/putrescine transport system substrate-binding protein [Mumia flava]